MHKQQIIHSSSHTVSSHNADLERNFNFNQLYNAVRNYIADQFYLENFLNKFPKKKTLDLQIPKRLF